MMRLIALIVSILAMLVSVWAMAAKYESTQDVKLDNPAIFFTGHELGELKPCGCSGGQLGGIDRRKAVIDTVDPSKRFVLDTGRLVKDSDEQATIKFNILIEAFNLLGYDVVNFQKPDIEMASELGLGQGITHFLQVISPYAPENWQIPQTYKKTIKLDDRKIKITAVTVDMESIDDPEKIQDLLGNIEKENNVKILILSNCDSKQVSDLADKKVADIFICPPQADEPVIINEKDNWPLVVSVGRFGKYVGKIDIIPQPNSSDLKLKYTTVKVEESLARADELVDLYRSYQKMVADANLIEKLPRFALPEGISYVGNKTCSICHSYEYEKWSTKKHAHAYQTLVDVGSEKDPECVICHVVGLEYESGFISEQETPNLKDVGCETCHGPASRHVASAGEAPLGDPKMMCEQCHTPENSADYAGNEDIYFEKIIHWREPDSSDSVKDNEDADSYDD